MKKVLPYMDYDTGLRAIRSYVWGVLMVYFCQGTPPLSKSPEDYWKDGKPDQAKWDKMNKETAAGDYETHVYKVSNYPFILNLRYHYHKSVYLTSGRNTRACAVCSIFPSDILKRLIYYLTKY